MPSAPPPSRARPIRGLCWGASALMAGDVLDLGSSCFSCATAGREKISRAARKHGRRIELPLGTWLAGPRKTSTVLPTSFVVARDLSAMQRNRFRLRFLPRSQLLDE